MAAYLRRLGYSPLKQIDTGNVKNLTVAWIRAMAPGAAETTPMVHDGVLFTAIDLR